LRLPLRRSSVILKELGEGAVLFSTETEVYFSLNQIGLRVWRSLPPACSQMDQVVATIHAQFPEVSRETIASDIRSLIDELRDHGLVEFEPGASSPNGPGTDVAHGLSDR
jgi:coenzyme PQQ synthesis protein D (PqqD)